VSGVRVAPGVPLSSVVVCGQTSPGVTRRQRHLNDKTAAERSSSLSCCHSKSQHSRWTPLKLLSLSLDELRKWALEDASESVEAINRTSKTRDRSSSIRTYVLRRADGNCEGCDRRAPFETEEGSPYLEPHHIRRLSDGGPDHPEWVIALCPNCHARAHHAQDKKAFNNQLRQIVLKIEITK